MRDINTGRFLQINNIVDNKKQCSKCNKIKSINDFYKRDDRLNGYQSSCKLCCNKATRASHNKYKLDRNKKDSERYLKNKEKYLIRKRQYMKDKYKYNAEHRIRILLQCRLKRLNGTHNYLKVTKELIGCNVLELKQHLQQTALNNGYKNFDIDNYSGKDYHIDHIKPCVMFNLLKLEEQKKCFNFKNLQILTAKENLSKGDKYE